MRRDLPGLWLPEALADLCALLRLSLDPRTPPPDRSAILRSWGLLAEDPDRDPDTVARNLLLFHAQAQSVKNAKK